MLARNFTFVLAALYGYVLPDASRIALAASGRAVPPMVLVREDVLVFSGTVDDEARKFRNGAGSHFRHTMVTHIA